MDLLPGDSYASFKVFLLAVPSDSRERRGLAQVSIFKAAVARDVVISFVSQLGKRSVFIGFF